MTNKIASILALVAFALCLLVGSIQAGNPFVTTVWRALIAMAGTYAIGLVVGLMVQRMLEENLRQDEEKLRNSTKVESKDR